MLKQRRKSSIELGQVWFPQNWTSNDIDDAAKYVINNNMTQFDNLADGIPIFDNYQGVRVGIIKTEGKFATTFPDNQFQPNSEGDLILKPKF